MEGKGKERVVVEDVDDRALNGTKAACEPVIPNPGKDSEKDGDDDDEWEEEEFHVVMEIADFTGSNLLAASENYSLIDLDSEHPILKVDDEFYQGTYEPMIGTAMLFSTPTEPTAQLTHEGEAEPITHICNTSKRLVFHKIQLQPINTPPTPTTPTTSSTPTTTTGGNPYMRPTHTIRPSPTHTRTTST
eukprot:TRINITY_DN9169_c0_g1_i1.p1 TRINITY_DN9169_c0_g1~~TRINITY_DN9169_c0_g1_i1.p1  ORF type:complete len:189 (-),score=52.25 TRINITY_DN9169_c0_g1_i1:62-628(-)